MQQVVEDCRSGAVSIAEVGAPACRAGMVLVHTKASLISAGTEAAALRFGQQSLLQKARSRPDLARQVLEKVRTQGLRATYEVMQSRLDVPLALGYSSAGVVLEVGAATEGIRVDDQVACAGGGYASHAEVVAVPRNLVIPVPEGVSAEDGAFATVGAVALQGLRVADVRVGERVLVMGLGLVGLLTVQLLKAAGCLVVGTDLNPDRVALARELGANESYALDAITLLSAIDRFTRGRGVDAAVITAATRSNQPIELAGEVSRLKGRVVVVGDVRMDVPRRAYYEKELELRVSRSYGPGRYDPSYEEKGIDYPYAYVPFTEQRNMETFLELVAEGRVTPGRLITHRFAVDAAESAYALIQGEVKEPYLGVLLTYPDRPDLRRKVAVAPVLGAGCSVLPNGSPVPTQHAAGVAAAGRAQARQPGTVRSAGGAGEAAGYPPHAERTRGSRVPAARRADARQPEGAVRCGPTQHAPQGPICAGVIGAGSYARLMLLPKLKSMREVQLVGVCTSRGLNAWDAAGRFGFEFATTDLEAILGDDRVNLVLIATRHDSHAPLAEAALRAGKHVFVEKPLATNEADLRRLVDAAEGADRHLIVGFNRRFAPLIQQAREKFRNHAQPLAMLYRVNAGAVPPSHWTRDGEEGGGRLVGEVCHFIDLLQYLCGSEPISVSSSSVAGGTGSFSAEEIVTLTLHFADGSMGTIHYFANGDKAVPKEYLEVYGDGKTFVLEDFRTARYAAAGKIARWKRGSQDKGQGGELRALVDAIRTGSPNPIPLSEAVLTTLATFRALDSLRRGTSMPVTWTCEGDRVE